MVFRHLSGDISAVAANAGLNLRRSWVNASEGCGIVASIGVKYLYFVDVCAESVFWNSLGGYHDSEASAVNSFVWCLLLDRDCWRYCLVQFALIFALSNAPQRVWNHRDGNHCVKFDTVNFTRLFGIRIARGPFKIYRCNFSTPSTFAAKPCVLTPL